MRGQQQRAAVCRRLCELALMEQGRGTQLMIELAWASWFGQRGPDPDTLFEHLTPMGRKATLMLSLAVLDGPESIDCWLQETAFLVKE